MKKHVIKAMSVGLSAITIASSMNFTVLASEPTTGGAESTNEIAILDTQTPLAGAANILVINTAVTNTNSDENTNVAQNDLNETNSEGTEATEESNDLAVKSIEDEEVAKAGGERSSFWVRTWYGWAFLIIGLAIGVSAYKKRKLTEENDKK